MSKYYVRYQDDGPMGLCGQAMSITMPWDRLYVFDCAEDADRFCAGVRESNGRKNARVTARWDDFIEQNVLYYRKGEL